MIDILHIYQMYGFYIPLYNMYVLLVYVLDVWLIQVFSYHAYTIWVRDRVAKG